MTLRRVHPGGFFWTMDRADRNAFILRIAASMGKMVLFAQSDASAKRLAERLTLSGVPVLLAGSRADAIEQFVDDEVSSLVTTTAHLVDDGPVTAPIVIHSRMATSIREYTRRVDSAVAPVHISFVVPEDESIAARLIPQLGDALVVEFDDDDPLASVLEDARTGEAVTVGPRRRFPLTR